MPAATALRAVRRCRRLVLPALLGTLLCACSGRDGDAADAFRDGRFERAFDLFSARAAAGDVSAVNFLGIHYYLGAGVPRDHARAARYFEQAALANHADAQRNLAVMYMRGLGVPQDKQLAYGWFFQAYSGGNATAREYLRALSDDVTPNAGNRARETVAALLREHALGTGTRSAAPAPQ